MTRFYHDRIAGAADRKKSRLVAAIDPSPAVSDPRRFAENMIKLLQAHVCAVKLNFHVILPLSASDLACVTRLAHSFGLQCIADVKLNDIESTNDVVVEHLLSRMGFDAVIANPFIGGSALRSLVKSARHAGGGVIALVYMSHPGAAEGYGLRVGGKQEIYRVFLERAENAGADGIVVGASQLELIRKISADSRIPIYSPGVGTQGGDAASTAKSGASYIIVGRSIIESKNPAGAAAELNKMVSAAVGD